MSARMGSVALDTMARFAAHPRVTPYAAWVIIVASYNYRRALQHWPVLRSLADDMGIHSELEDGTILYFLQCCDNYAEWPCAVPQQWHVI